MANILLVCFSCFVSPCRTAKANLSMLVSSVGVLDLYFECMLQSMFYLAVMVHGTVSIFSPALNKDGYIM